MEMNAAGARSLQQMDFSRSPSDGVNINRGRALWYRYNALGYSSMQYHTGLLLGIQDGRPHRIILCE